MSISINQENIEILFNALNKTKKRVKKLEKKTVGVNENEKNYNYDDSLERLFVITNGQTTRLDEIEERINGIVSLLGINEVPETSGRDDGRVQLINVNNEHLNQSENSTPSGGGRTRRKRTRKKKRKKKTKKRRKKSRKKRTKRRR
tara:strand:+ start:87 stop:524 length:438 start_codon:yes stop_codon:yes gene_type:complete